MYFLLLRDLLALCELLKSCSELHWNAVALVLISSLMKPNYNLQCLISNLIWIFLFTGGLPPMEFYIRTLLFSDLKPSRFFDLPNIARGNNFHQINRRNLLILPRRLWGGMGKPPPRTLWHSISFIIFPDFFHYIPQISFILDFSIFVWNEISWFSLFQYSSYHVYFQLINDGALSGNLQDNA